VTSTERTTRPSRVQARAPERTPTTSGPFMMNTSLPKASPPVTSSRITPPASPMRLP
jgi:hypothetical protein